MSKTVKDRTIALAGVFQSAYLVQQVARHNRETNAAVRASIHSLFKIDAEDIIDVYGGMDGVLSGLKTLHAQLSSDNRHNRDMELTRYVVALLFLERKLAKRPKMLEQLHSGVTGAGNQAEYFFETHANVIARLADLYQHTISTMTPRIMVSGESAVLSNPDNANLIRALLLAGIRSAVLWRQCGGGRLQLLIQRRAIVQTAADLIAAIPAAGSVGESSDTLH